MEKKTKKDQNRMMSEKMKGNQSWKQDLLVVVVVSVIWYWLEKQENSTLKIIHLMGSMIIHFMDSTTGVSVHILVW